MKHVPSFVALLLVGLVAPFGCTGSENKPLGSVTPTPVDGGASSASDAATSGDASEADAASAADGATTDGAVPSSSSCTITLSGALSGTIPCTASLGYDAKNNLGVLGVSPVGSPTVHFTGSASFPGQPHTGTYQSTDAGAKGGLSVQQGTPTWFASSGGSSTQGSYALTLNSVTNPRQTSSGDMLYDTSGVLTATLPAITGTGASGTVMVSVTF